MGYREFVDDAGAMWRVWDTYPVAVNTLRTVSPTFAGGWLTFESDHERRRLAPIPADWHIASIDLLAHWCARALSVRGPERNQGLTESQILERPQGMPGGRGS